MSFSPEKNPSTPPLFGSVDAISARVFPAIAAFATKSAFIPDITFENPTIASPNGTNCVAKSVKELPPVSHDVTP